MSVTNGCQKSPGCSFTLSFPLPVDLQHVLTFCNDPVTSNIYLAMKFLIFQLDFFTPVYFHFGQHIKHNAVVIVVRWEFTLASSLFKESSAATLYSMSLAPSPVHLQCSNIFQSLQGNTAVNSIMLFILQSANEPSFVSNATQCNCMIQLHCILGNLVQQTSQTFQFSRFRVEYNVSTNLRASAVPSLNVQHVCLQITPPLHFSLRT